MAKSQSKARKAVRITAITLAFAKFTCPETFFSTSSLFIPLAYLPVTFGILTLSRYRIQSAVRRSFPITDNFIDKLFDLDRCFAVNYLPVEGSDKKLVLINLHMSRHSSFLSDRRKDTKGWPCGNSPHIRKSGYFHTGGGIREENSRNRKIQVQLSESQPLRY